jgi:LPXTG-motif cell wall-anchored protein
MAEPVAGAAPRLPDTGVAAALPTALGVGVVALGALALLLARRRHRASAAGS